jgi:Domain of unknown function (DUF1707)
MMGELAPRGPEDLPQEASQLRASHEDRDAVIETLRVAAGDGRLTGDELDDRLEIAFNAKTYGELAVLTSDLPVSATAAAVAPAGPPKDVVRIDCGSGNAVRDGHWVVPKRLEVRVTSGNVKLDFTSAAISQPVLEIDAEVRSGNLIIITKPGVAVDTDDVTVRSGNIKVARPPWGPVPVRLQISVSGRVASGNIVARHKRRNLWQWLTRQPMPWVAAAS